MAESANEYDEREHDEPTTNPIGLYIDGSDPSPVGAQGRSISIVISNGTLPNGYTQFHKLDGARWSGSLPDPKDPTLGTVIVGFKIT